MAGRQSGFEAICLAYVSYLWTASLVVMVAREDIDTAQTRPSIRHVEIVAGHPDARP
jgi:hypothetical protein